MQLEEQVNALLESYSKLIDDAIGKIVPQEFDIRSLLSYLGEPKYEYELVAVNEGITKPFWDLITRGGKRWRPALMLLTYQALGGKLEQVIEYAAIPEIIHNATLIVDDVEDNSQMRRNKPCIHRIYGVDIAINAGNTLYYLPILYILKNVEEGKRCRILQAYVRQMTYLSIGQAMDIAWHRGLMGEISENQYLQMCAFKTGSVSKFAVELACIFADADAKTTAALSDFGETVGVAFQIQDDLLNLVGEEAKYGKEVGGDITEGKRTLMVVYALRNLPADERERLKQILDKHTTDKREIEEAISLIKKSGAIEYAQKVARRLMLESWARADEVLPPSDAKNNLRLLAEYLIERSR
ncbi:MAG: polyprenyl synthetase family protein [Aigarchaeota archaeon]|nr:polyprenyl synthetase family protein [Candidatus Pelearchaeum maunauluense]